MEFNSDGIVIRETIQGENDKLLTILTPLHGKITAYAKGVKKISSKNAPACQLFVYSDFEFLQKSGRTVVKTATSKDLFYDMRSDMTRYSLACYFADILSHTCMENNDETETVRLFLNCLYALSYKKDISLAAVKAVFELKLMCYLGFMPDFESCIHCACDVTVRKNNLFSFEESGVLCENCTSKPGKNPPSFSCNVSKGVLCCMKYICSSPQSKMLMFAISQDELKELSFVCENYLIHKTERTYETLKIYKSIINSLGEK